ncbi:MAG TPA: hypothetical protein VGJ95_08725 [Pseudonocardiaceae bacterium]
MWNDDFTAKLRVGFDLLDEPLPQPGDYVELPGTAGLLLVVNVNYEDRLVTFVSAGPRSGG